MGHVGGGGGRPSLGWRWTPIDLCAPAIRFRAGIVRHWETFRAQHFVAPSISTRPSIPSRPSMPSRPGASLRGRAAVDFIRRAVAVRTSRYPVSVLVDRYRQSSNDPSTKQFETNNTPIASRRWTSRWRWHWQRRKSPKSW